MAALRERKVEEEVAMSDAGLLLSVEDLISFAFAFDSSLVNFDMLETIINVLARQMRVLEHDVEIRLDEHEDNLLKIKKAFGAPITPEELAAAAAKAAAEAEAREAAEREAAEKEAAEREAAERAAAEAVEEEEPIVVQQLSGTSKTDSKTRIGAIDAVSPRTFHEVNNQVIELLRRTKGDPRVLFALPTLPSNEDFLTEIAKGTVSMMEVMETMQVLARVETAEDVIAKMAEILTRLVMSGVLPPEVLEIIQKMQEDMARIALETDEPKPDEVSEELAVESPEEFDFATRPELEQALQEIEDEYRQTANARIAENRANVSEVKEESRSRGEKMGIALRLDGRVKHQQTYLTETNEQLDEVDQSMNEQLNAFNALLRELRAEIDAGIERFESLNNNAEIIAMNNYKAGYDNMLVDLEEATNEHRALTALQKRLSDDLKFMTFTLNLFREEKADRDEVKEGLKEKAKLSRLRGLVTQPTFEKFRAGIEHGLILTLKKFAELEKEWLIALKDVNHLVHEKAAFINMSNFKEYATQAINEQYAILRRLDALLGDPKTAILTRKLAVDSHCGACVTPALMDVYDKRSEAPARLPAMILRGPINVASPPAVRNVVDTSIMDPRTYKCKRYVGGSHTLLKDHKPSHKGEAPEPVDTPPVKRYTGCGIDGKLYLMEEELEPCRECNNSLTPEMDVMQSLGGGDNA